MWAMIPMLRVLARAVTTSATLQSSLVCLGASGRLVATRCGLPAVVGEGLVGLGHLVGVLAPLDARAEAVARVEQLVHEALGHRLLPALPRVADEPAQGERGAPARAHLDGHLVGRATDASALDLDRGL